MKLNIGPGEHYAAGWTNLDTATSDEVKVDIQGSLLHLPAEVQDVEAVYMGHILEHIAPPTVIPALAALWGRCRPGAQVAAVGPDVLRVVDMHIIGQADWQTVTHCCLGERRWPGDEHLWACTEQRLLELIRASGLQRVRAVPIASPVLDDFPVVSRIGWQCAVIGEVRQ